MSGYLIKKGTNQKAVLVHINGQPNHNGRFKCTFHRVLNIKLRRMSGLVWVVHHELPYWRRG